MAIKRIHRELVVVCDKCGEVISWTIDSNLGEDDICSKCIDKKRGIYHVVNLTAQDLDILGFRTDNVSCSDDRMAELASNIKDYLYIGPFFDVVKKCAEDMGFRKKEA